MTNAKRLTVFEIINERRREVFVGATDKQIFELAAAIHKKLPPELSDWDLKDATTLRSVEFDLTHDGAKAFIAEYARSAAPLGWRFLIDPKFR